MKAAIIFMLYSIVVGLGIATIICLIALYTNKKLKPKIVPSVQVVSRKEWIG